MHPDWKPDWPRTRERLVLWWNHQGLVVRLAAPRETPRDAIQEPTYPENISAYWLDPDWRTGSAEAAMARTDFLAESFPYFDTHIGPGSLSLILGSEPHFDRETVWYQPCINDPDAFGSIEARLDGANRWWQAHQALVKAGIQHAAGRYPVGMPDLVEGLDTLAAMRGNSPMLFDLIERPGWVCDRLAEINTAYFAVFNAIYDQIQDEFQGNAFSAFGIWGPGKTAKLQCDFSAMISPKMFARFVVPFLTEQCAWLDYSMYHLDGTNARQHLDALLTIDGLDAIEWTPQSGKPGGGSPDWFPMYKRIKAAGKSIQAVDVEIDKVIPMLDEVGPAGTFIILRDGYTRAEADQLYKDLEPYYPG